MEYINDVTIQEAIIHVLDGTKDEPILNSYLLDLNEDVYKFLYKHIERTLKSDDLKTAKFVSESNSVKELIDSYLIGESKDVIELSQELSKELFAIIKGNVNIPSCDLIVVSLLTDQGPVVGLLKMDYVKTFTHNVVYEGDKTGIGIVPQDAGLPSSGQKIQKAAFIRKSNENNKFDLWVLDKTRRKDDEYGSNYFLNTFLGCTAIVNDREMTKTFFKASENWTRNNLIDDAEKAEEFRRLFKKALEEEDKINIDDFALDALDDNKPAIIDYSNYVKSQGLEDFVDIDKEWVEKKFKKIKLKVDSDVVIYIDKETYENPLKFEIIKNGDGSINICVKYVKNYIET